MLKVMMRRMVTDGGDSVEGSGNDKCYLGMVGKNYYAKPWGNDSSGVQAVVNGPAYWKRIYHRLQLSDNTRRPFEHHKYKQDSTRTNRSNLEETSL
eukprot:369760-Amphidinium_carterae.1